MQGTVLGTGNPAKKETDHGPCPHGAHIPVEEIDHNIYNGILFSHTKE